MSTRRKTASSGWFPMLVGAIAVALADGAGAEPTEAAVAEAYARSCVAPYHEELAGAQATQFDREAYQRVVLAARAAAADSCSAFVERIEKHAQPGVEESQELRDARELLAEPPRGRCVEARMIAEVVRSAESLYELALCHPFGEEGTALLREAVEINPGHLGALSLLMIAVLDTQTRAEYGASLYQRSEDIDDRMDAAKAIIEGAVDRGDLAAVLEIRERIRRDLLSQPPLRRCAANLDSLGLREVCLEAIEAIAAGAASASEALPDQVVSRVDDLFWDIGLSINMPNHIRSEAEVAELLATPGVRAELAAAYAHSPEILEIFEDEVELARWMRGTAAFVELLDHDARLADWLGWEPWGVRKAGQAERLKAVLENHPERLRTSRHYLALAQTASTWRERIGSLRRAVELEAGSVRARCELAGALARVGDLAGARRGYRDLLADEDGSCNARGRLEALNNQAPEEVAPLDGPGELFFYLK